MPIVFLHTLILEIAITDSVYRNFNELVNKMEEYCLQGFNGKQMWNNGSSNIFCSSNVFIFHSSSSGGQFYAALASTHVALQINVH